MKCDSCTYYPNGVGNFCNQKCVHNGMGKKNMYSYVKKEIEYAEMLGLEIKEIR